MFYGSKCLAIKKHHIQKIDAVEIRMLKHTSVNTLRDGIRSECVHKKLEVTLAADKIILNRLNWFRHVQWRTFMISVWKSDIIVIHGVRRTRDRCKRTRMKAIKNNIRVVNLIVENLEMTLNCDEWKKDLFSWPLNFWIKRLR